MFGVVVIPTRNIHLAKGIFFNLFFFEAPSVPGAMSVGKTSIIARFMYNTFDKQGQGHAASYLESTFFYPQLYLINFYF